MTEGPMFGMLVNAPGACAVRGNMFPQSDAEDMCKGARSIPGLVTDARRRGETVQFNTDCENSPCCWYWKFQDGTRIYHYEEMTSKRLLKDHQGRCPLCGNTNVRGGTIKA